VCCLFVSGDVEFCKVDAPSEASEEVDIGYKTLGTLLLLSRSTNPSSSGRSGNEVDGGVFGGCPAKDNLSARCAKESRNDVLVDGAGLGGFIVPSLVGVGGNAVLGAGLGGGGTDSRLDVTDRVVPTRVCELTVLQLWKEDPEARFENGCMPENPLLGLVLDFVEDDRLGDSSDGYGCGE
jgi:hypothetical protein